VEDGMTAKHGIVLDPEALKIAAECLWDEFCPGIRKTDDDEAFYLARAEAVISAYLAAGGALNLAVPSPKAPTP
jgi:hypothetical protein